SLVLTLNTPAAQSPTRVVKRRPTSTPAAISIFFLPGWTLLRGFAPFLTLTVSLGATALSASNSQCEPVSLWVDFDLSLLSSTSARGTIVLPVFVNLFSCAGGAGFSNTTSGGGFGLVSARKNGASAWAAWIGC